ncbi:aspartate ammonia-lyase [Anaerocolumna sedimenticola]|uniref:Aspartate ammonia-lyase n=1 Tax=Anaerocolumna sedimenticola TaxID=2696063 RepID=A0A6P1TU35_9FIRM|nr:aspartate ammonia-lyase [Anaerocolumna sedimenticola]QHQ63206.1 aspartate ammonia-lyase [Anaerocolumna sedimenticola]
MRIESDKLGQMEFSDKELYGLQTKRAYENFKLDHKATNLNLIYSIVKIKKAAAMTYINIGADKKGIYPPIINACDLILAGEANEQFITQSLQGGAGTSTNMNVNEVIANLTLKALGHPPGSYDIIHPLDDVNRGQSTNDVYPTALRITAIETLRILSIECAKLQEALQKKENEYDSIKKVGRTELMDAVPVTLGSEFGAYAQAIARDRWRLYKVEERLRQVNIGGTAIGTGTNADKQYRFGIIEVLRDLTGIGLAVSEYPLDITQNNDVFVEVSGLLKALAVNLMKVSGDLRLMNSNAIGEIRLKPMQLGSTIMPGKINPVIPEMVTQVAMRVMANDYAITTASALGEFELNAFLPLIADSLLESLELLVNAVKLFREKCIDLTQPNPVRCDVLLNSSFAFATEYTAKLGYETVSRVLEQYKEDKERAKQILDNMLPN